MRVLGNDMFDFVNLREECETKNITKRFGKNGIMTNAQKQKNYGLQSEIDKMQKREYVKKFNAATPLSQKEDCYRKRMNLSSFENELTMQANNAP